MSTLTNFADIDTLNDDQFLEIDRIDTPHYPFSNYTDTPPYDGDYLSHDSSNESFPKGPLADLHPMFSPPVASIIPYIVPKYPNELRMFGKISTSLIPSSLSRPCTPLTPYSLASSPSSTRTLFEWSESPNSSVSYVATSNSISLKDRINKLKTHRRREGNEEYYTKDFERKRKANVRERERNQCITETFANLSGIIPTLAHDKSSKLRIARRAIR